MSRTIVACVAVLGGCQGQPPASSQSGLVDPHCGDDRAQGLEMCDGKDLRGAACANFGFNAGSLSCRSDCSFDLSGCRNVEICDNGLDDDGNGDKDCDDAACANDPACAVCGDGKVTGGEQCDDGNHVGGDCCDSACRAEPGCEVEPNDAIATAMAWPGGTVRGWIRGADADFFALAIPEGSTGSLDATVTSALSSVSCLGELDSLLEVVGADGSVLFTDDDGGEGTCSRLVVAGIPPGAVLRVSRSPVDRVQADFFYSLTVVLATYVCGNGVVDPGEECDDGNRADGDGCSHMCRVEPLVEQVPNDTPATATSVVGPPFLVVATLSDAGDRDYYAFDLPSYAKLRLETSGDCLAIDTVLELLDAGGALLYRDDDGGSDRCSLIETELLRPGRYVVGVSGYGAGTYRLDASYLATCDTSCEPQPFCGDGVVNSPSEECDDGGSACCDATCHAAPGCEREPDDDAATALPLPPLPTSISGALFPAGDVDVYGFQLGTASDVTIEASGGGAGCVGLDSYLTLFDGSGAVVASDDDSGGIFCPRITVRLDAGSYRIAVATRMAFAMPPPVYKLSLALEP